MTNKTIVKGNRVDIIPVAVIIICSVFRNFSPQLNSMILTVILPILMVWCIIRDNRLLHNQTIQLFLALVFWILITLTTSVDVSYSLKVLKPILGGVVTSIIMYSLSRNNQMNSRWLFISYILMFSATLYYLYTTGDLFAIDIQKTRLETDEGINANDFAYYLFYITIAISLFFWDGFKGLSYKEIVFYIIILVVTLYISLITASRQVIVVVLPFIAFSIFIRTAKRLSLRSILLFVIPLIIITVMVYSYYMNNYYEGSYLETRMEIGLGDEDRMILLKRGFNLGMAHPIFGVGIGNMANLTRGSFSHNSFVELFATTGIIGSLIFTVMILETIKINYKRYKITKNGVFLYLTWSFGAWAIYNFLFVFYISPWLMSFFFLLVGYSECLYKQEKIKHANI